MLSLRRQLLRSLSFAFGSKFLLGSKQLGMALPVSEPLANSPAVGVADRDNLPSEVPAEKVLGIGGFFFRARDPKSLARWYQQNLGINLSPKSFTDTPWQQEAGPTIFDPMLAAGGVFKDTDKVWKINFRVRDIEKMAAQLKAAGADVKVDPQSYNGNRFAQLTDPEGNPIELWEFKTPDASH